MRDEDKTKEQLLTELAQLRQKERFYKNVLDQLPVCTIIYDEAERVVYRNRTTKDIDGFDDEEMLYHTSEEGGCIYSNEQTCSITGFSENELKGLEWLKAVHPEDRDKVVREWQNCLSSQQIFKLEHRFIRPDGKISWVIGQAAPFLGRGNKLLGYVGTLSDITERKEAEEALRESEQEKALILEAISELVVYHDTDMRIIWANKAACESSGLPPDLVKGRHCYEVWHQSSSPCPGCPVQKALATGLYQEGEMITPDGQNWLIKGHPVKSDNGKVLGIVEVAVDITGRKRLEQEMALLDRLNLVGEMAAGIGHEIRNPMTTIRGFLQMLGEKKECARHKEYFDLMIEELDRANSIITELLYLAKDKAIQLKVHNLNDIIETLYPLLQADGMVFDKYVSLELSDLPDLLLDDKEIRQLVLNLVRNGLEAMFPGRSLTIKTYLESGQAVLAIRDQGQGFEPAILEKIGTPFLTTKEQGTGLGLAVCYRIAERHKAGIEVETGPGGTTFYIKFNQRADHPYQEVFECIVVSR